MAITRTTAMSTKAQVHMYGLSTDSKPTTGLSVGMKFRETDGSRDVYIWSGSAWVILEI